MGLKNEVAKSIREKIEQMAEKSWSHFGRISCDEQKLWRRMIEVQWALHRSHQSHSRRENLKSDKVLSPVGTGL